MAIDDYDHLIVGAANQYNVDPQLLKAVMSVESSGKPNAYNRASGATGLMQFIPSTAQEQGVLPTDPVSSVYGGAAYLSQLLDKYGNVDAALQHYSGGGGAAYARKIVDAYHTVAPPAAAVAPSTPPEAPPASPSGAPATDQPVFHTPASDADEARIDQVMRDHPTPQPPSSASVPQTDTDPSSPTVGEPTYAHLTRPSAPADLTLDKGQPGQPGPNVRTTETTPHAPGGPTPPASEGGLPPGLGEILHGTSPPAAPAEAPGSDEGLPPGLKDIIRPAAPAVSAAPPAPPPTPEPAPAATPSAPPIYTAPTVPLIGKEQLSQTMPVSPPGGVPAITPENEVAFAGFSHGARQAVNPLLEFGSGIGNYIASATGLPIATDRAANDAAKEAAFQAQYGNNPIATNAAGATRFALPLVLGGASGTALRLGLEAAGLPGTAAFLSGTGGAQTPGVLGFGTRLASGATAGGLQGLVAGGPWGAITGAALGATVLPAVGSVADWATGRASPTAAAARQIYQAMMRDGMTPQQVETAVGQLGDLGTIADVDSANVRQLAEGVANASGPGQQVARQYLSARNAGQTKRLDDAVKTATGATGSAFDNMEALQQARSTAAAPAYQAAFANTVPTLADAMQVSRFINTPIGQRALQNGIADAQLRSIADGTPFSLADYGVTQAKDGSYLLTPGTPNLRGYDAVKRGFDTLVDKFRDPTSGRLVLSGTQAVPGVGEVSGTALNDVRSAYTGELRNLFPEYAKALDAWAGPSADMDALSMGRRVLSEDADQTASNIARLTPSQQQMYQVGVAQTLRDRILRTADSGDASRSIWGNELVRERIAAGFGGESSPAFQNFQRTMENEAQYAQTGRQLLAGSPTARRTEAINLVQGGALPAHVVEPLTHLAFGNPLAAGLSVARSAANPLVSRLVAPSDRLNLALGNMLFNPNLRQQTFDLLRRGVSPSVRNMLVGPWGQQGAQLLLNDRTQSP